VLSNPPFGAKIELAEQPELSGFHMGNTHSTSGKSKPRKSQKSEIVFIERIYELLKPGTGRAAIILPDGILTNPRSQYVRQFMLDRFQLLAVVSLPTIAFMHYGAGVKASVVFVRRLADGEKPDDEHAVFMAEVENIGYDATGRDAVNDLPDVLAEYQRFLDHPAPFMIDLSPIVGAE